jgi:hypothetical protein
VLVRGIVPDGEGQGGGRLGVGCFDWAAGVAPRGGFDIPCSTTYTGCDKWLIDGHYSSHFLTTMTLKARSGGNSFSNFRPAFRVLHARTTRNSCSS